MPVAQSKNNTKSLPRKERERLARRLEIVRAARSVFAEKGFEKATLEEIAERAEFGKGGPFLFGAFSIADAFFAPVVSRFVTYGIAAAGPVRDYMDAVLALPAMQEWMREARAEATFVEADEPYRKHR